MNLITPPVPDKPLQLRRFALGAELHDWSKRFQPSLLQAADSALASLHEQLEQVQRDLSSLDPLLTGPQEYQAEQTRLNNLLSSLIGSIEKLGNFHGKLTAVSAAALLHAMTRNGLADTVERDATPRRRLGSAAGQVVDIEV
jgi:hypothetical protein